MNFIGLQNQIWTVRGYPDTATAREDAALQRLRDAINGTLSEICNTRSPRLFGLEREGTLTVVSGTREYYLDDWCKIPLAFLDQNGLPVVFNRKKTAEVQGLNYNQTAGGIGTFYVVPAPRNNAAALAGASGAGTGATVAEGATAVTFGASSNITAAYNGRMIRFNGETEDYVFTYVGATSGTIDRAFRTRLSGVGTAGSAGATGLSAVRWEIGPPLRFKIRLLPTPLMGQTLTYRYLALPRKLVNDSDTPEIQDEFHDLIWCGALRKLCSASEAATFSVYTSEYERALREMTQSDDDEVASNDGPTYATLESDALVLQNPGVYSRNMY